jgi:hypothetical protein
MKNFTVFKIASWVCLALVGLPSILSFSGWIDLKNVSQLALIGTIGWFSVTPFWMGKKS